MGFASRTTALADGNATGIAYVQANPGTYTLFTEAERNASALASRNTALAEGNATGIAHVLAGPNGFSLFTVSDTEQRVANARQAGLEAGNKQGAAEGLATVQAELAAEDLSLLSYLEAIKPKPHTRNWYYQPDLGWVWTQEEIFPHLYLANPATGAGTWLYFAPARNATSPFYDQDAKQWRNIGK